MDERGLLRMEVTVPSQQIVAAALLYAEEYKPLVEQALIEAREELLSDERLKEEMKAEIRRKMDEVIRKRIAETVEAVFRRAEWDFFDVADKVLKDFAEKKR